MSSVRLIYVTCESTEQAQRLAHTLLAERLAACANILPGMQSIYWWQGQVEQATETVLILKTQAALEDSLIGRVRDLHSYELPCVLSWPIAEGNPNYLQWIINETTPRP